MTRISCLQIVLRPRDGISPCTTRYKRLDLLSLILEFIIYPRLASTPNPNYYCLLVQIEEFGENPI